MNSANLSTVSKGLLLSAALAASSQAQANSVNVIFAAENALYGAGYYIGQADGWMDKALRQGIRDFQTRNGTLEASGVLDPDTLSALGIFNSSGRAVSGNVVANKTAALAALGISEPKPGSKAQPQRRLQPKPAFSVKEIAPEPAAAPVAASTPAEPYNTQGLAVAEKPKPQVQSHSQPNKPADAVVSEPTPKAAPQTTATPPTKVVNESAPAPAAHSSPSAPKAEPVPQSVEKPAPGTDVAKVKSPAPETAEPTNAETVAWMRQLPNEATAAEKSEVDEPVAQAPKTEAQETPTAQTAQREKHAEPKDDRNIFGSLFRFLFGWMV
ncbi:peptidoglycan-binding protein [Marinobacter sp.]|uniref:peptidoglycan-binding protein n=1 Tax=Marinobacter sp. TaxID=50741 RepID=UPI002356CC93|nr:peptidoglycan-binding protein [Marinobacter sp.]